MSMVTIVISSNDTEKAWNAFRLANLAAEKKDSVIVYLINGGVECIVDAENFDTKHCPKN